MNYDLAAHAAHLSGYLSGLAAVDGHIREFLGAAFVVSGEGSDTPEAMIRDYYAAQTDFQFSSSQKLESGLGSLERELCAYVVRSPWGPAGQAIDSQSINDRRRFLAFRIMDMISDMAPEAYPLRTVYKLESKQHGEEVEVTFFCVKINAGFLVLQFNDSKPFIRAQEAR